MKKAVKKGQVMEKKAVKGLSLSLETQIQIALYVAAFFLFWIGIALGIRDHITFRNFAVLGTFTIAVLNTLWIAIRFLKSGKKVDGKLLVQSLIQIAAYVTAFFLFFLGLGIGLAVNPLIGTLLMFTAFGIGGLNTVWIILNLVKFGKE